MTLGQGSAAFAAQATALATRRGAWPLLESIDVPALIARGVEDRVCLAEQYVRLAAQLPPTLATLKSIPGAGHLPPLEQPEATGQILCDWLQTVVERQKQRLRDGATIDSRGREF